MYKKIAVVMASLYCLLSSLPSYTSDWNKSLLKLTTPPSSNFQSIVHLLDENNQFLTPDKVKLHVLTLLKRNGREIISYAENLVKSIAENNSTEGDITAIWLLGENNVFKESYGYPLANLNYYSKENFQVKNLKINPKRALWQLLQYTKDEEYGNIKITEFANELRKELTSDLK